MFSCFFFLINRNNNILIQVMETKESVSTELDPNVPVEDVVTALNVSTVGSDVLTKEKTPEK